MIDLLFQLVLHWVKRQKLPIVCDHFADKPRLFYLMVLKSAFYCLYINSNKLIRTKLLTVMSEKLIEFGINDYYERYTC